MPWTEPSISVFFQFAGLHHWPDAPASHSFLALPHRHLFECTAELTVRHDDRELEFFAVQEFISKTVDEWPYDMGEKSCEQMAKEIAEALLNRYGNDRLVTVSVTEDGENGANVTWRPEVPLGWLG